MKWFEVLTQVLEVPVLMEMSVSEGTLIETAAVLETVEEQLEYFLELVIAAPGMVKVSENLLPVSLKVEIEEAQLVHLNVLLTEELEIEEALKRRSETEALMTAELHSKHLYVLETVEVKGNHFLELGTEAL